MSNFSFSNDVFQSRLQQTGQISLSFGNGLEEALLWRETQADFQKCLKDKPKVMVDFYATWCGPCKVISPKVEAFEKEFTDITFTKVDVDENEETATNCKVSAMPTFKFFLNGKEVKEVVGASEENLRNALVELNKM